MNGKMLRIKTSAGVLRRCGVDFYENPTEYPVARFKPHQLESLKDDPLLIVEEVEEEKPFPEGKYEQEGYV
jgi:hypothetical protein